MNSAFQEFNQIDGQIESAYHEAALRMKLSDSEFWIFYALATHAPGCLQTDLCLATGLSRSTVNSALKKLEKEGFLYMTPGSGRSTRVFLTEQGAARQRDTVCRLIALENRIYESWTQEEQALLLRLNRDFARRISEMVQLL